MARLLIGRLPQATETYRREQFDILIRELEQVTNQLNNSYEEQSKNENLARSWYLG